MTVPAFTIIVATRNAAATLRHCLASLRAQREKSFELLIADGASTDETPEVVAEFGDIVTRFTSEPDHGIYDAWNKAVLAARGEWICFLGADDELWDDCVLADYARFVDGTPGLRYVYGTVVYIDSDGRELRRVGSPWGEASIGWRRSMTVPHVAALHHRSLFANARFDPTYRIAADYRLLRPVLLREGAAFFDRPVARARWGGVSTRLEMAIPSALELRAVLTEAKDLSWHWYVGFAKTVASVTARRAFAALHRIAGADDSRNDPVIGGSNLQPPPVAACGTSSVAQGSMVTTSSPAAVRVGPAKRICFDCSGSHYIWVNSGIQRVVRNLVRHGRAVAAERNLDFAAVVSSGRRIREIDPASLPWMSDGLRQRTMATLFPLALAVKRRFDRLPTWLRPGRAVNCSANPGARWNASAERGESQAMAGSILVLLDNGVRTDAARASLQRFRAQGGFVVALIHDVIATTHPHCFAPAAVDSFHRYLDVVLEVADGAVCNSRSTQDALAALLAQPDDTGRPRRPIPSAHFRLGSELDLAKAETPPRQSVTEAMPAGSPAFLVVGSIEPRKNVGMVIDAFEELWRLDLPARLVLAGANHWRSDDLIERIHAHPEYQRRLFWLRDLGDTDLGHCYRRAAALIFASGVEGFGLPIVEAMQFGVPVLLSDIPVFREVAADYGRYFPLGDRASLAALLRPYVTPGMPVPARPAPVPSLSWNESCAQLVDRALELYSSAFLPASASGKP